MALVTCPECEKTDVSNGADSCPNCGYGVKNHFEQEKRKQFFAEQEKQYKFKRNQEAERLKPELEQKLKEIDNLPYPEKPSYVKILFSCLIVS